jgi:hypothetical protein
VSSLIGEDNYMTEAISQPLSRNPQLSLKDIETLPFQMHIDNNQITLKTGLNNNKLKHPVTLSLEKVFAAKEIGLIKYVFNALLCERPILLQYAFENQSVLKMARHFLRNCSGSTHSCYTYIQQLQQYTIWLGYSPDAIIKDLKPGGIAVDPVRLQTHTGFLSDYLATLQDQGLTPGVIVNRVKAAKAFYYSNGVKIELAEKLSRRITYKDRAPTSEELTKVLDAADIREKVIVTMLALGGFRIETLSKLKYRHVKEDMERNKIPIHVHVEIDIVKGKYAEFDTFLGSEAVNCLKLYFEQRRVGTRRIPAEVLMDDSPLIRDVTSKAPKHIQPKQIHVLIHQLYVKTGLTKHRNGHYDLRVHSIRKFFKTQLTALGLQTDYVEYFMGHKISTYHDIQSIGIDNLRSKYAAAGLVIRQRSRDSKVEQLKEMIRAFGMNPDQVLSRNFLADGAITTFSSEDQQLVVLRKQLKELILAETLG